MASAGGSKAGSSSKFGASNDITLLLQEFLSHAKKPKEPYHVQTALLLSRKILKLEPSNSIVKQYVPMLFKLAVQHDLIDQEEDNEGSDEDSDSSDGSDSDSDSGSDSDSDSEDSSSEEEPTPKQPSLSATAKDRRSAVAKVSRSAASPAVTVKPEMQIKDLKAALKEFAETPDDPNLPAKAPPKPPPPPAQ